MNRIYLLLFYIVFALFSSMDRSSARPAQEILWYQLTSPLETERYAALEQAMAQVDLIDVKDLENCLTSLRKKNVSTLIFVLMKSKNVVLYEINSLAQKALEHSDGSFPNIAYYYGRVNCEKGLKELLRLYKTFENQKLFICKAIGEIGTDEAVNFLISEAEVQKEAGKNIVPFLAGLKESKTVIDKMLIEYCLSSQINREELIALSYLHTNLTREDILCLYDKGEKQQEYVIQYLFSKPIKNFKIIQSIIQKELDSKEYEKILQWLRSDSLCLVKNHEIQEYRKKIITLIRELTSNTRSSSF